MHVLSAPVAVIAGVTLYVALHHLFLYARRSVKKPEDLSFALLCLTMSLYDIFCIGAYNNHSLETGLFWQRWQVATLSLFGAAFAWFLVDYTGTRNKRLRNFFAAYFVLAAMLSVFDNTGLSWRMDKPAVKTIPLPLGLDITYYEVTPGIMTTLVSLMGIAVFIYAFRLGIRLYRRDEKAKARPLFWSVAFFFFGLCNDAAVQSGLYKSIYLIEYTYMGIVIMMAYFLSKEIIQSAEMKEAVQKAYNQLVETSYRLSGSSQEVHSVTDTIDQAMTEMFTETQKQNEHIRNSHRTISDLLANIHAISREAQQGASITQGTARRITDSIGSLKDSFDRMKTAEQSLTDMRATIEAFSGHSKKVDAILGLIDDIASRINVLSLNVAIEASKAGGRDSGFMVVANEIRQLAKNTRAHTDEIAELITGFQEDIARVRTAMQKGLGQFQELGQSTERSRSGLNDILRLTEEEEQRLQRISTRILDLRAYSQQVEAEMGTVALVSEQNLKTAERVNTGTKAMSASMRELSVLADTLRETATAGISGMAAKTA
ncbi:MAG: methyl-accepting chemotaxis protein [bacterium]|nr:methyl-accepting chemotaxis protein [bacterium]